MQVYMYSGVILISPKKPGAVEDAGATVENRE
jgi:hypothetical protein